MQVLRIDSFFDCCNRTLSYRHPSFLTANELRHRTSVTVTCYLWVDGFSCNATRNRKGQTIRCMVDEETNLPFVVIVRQTILCNSFCWNSKSAHKSCLPRRCFLLCLHLHRPRYHSMVQSLPEDTTLLFQKERTCIFSLVILHIQSLIYSYIY